nr:DNA repair protein RAD51 homolog 4-like [Anolis sagrei ordinatus]
MILRPGLCPGLTPEAVALLRDQGIQTVVDLVSSDLEALAQRCSLSFKSLSSARRLLLARFSSFPANGADLFEELQKGGAILNTGINSLDRLLDSGLYTGEITEFVGAPGSGKTQVRGRLIIIIIIIIIIHTIYNIPGIHLQQRNLLRLGQQSQGQLRAARGLLHVVQVGQRGVFDEAGRAGTHVVPQGDARVNHRQRSRVHRGTFLFFSFLFFSFLFFSFLCLSKTWRFGRGCVCVLLPYRKAPSNPSRQMAFQTLLQIPQEQLSRTSFQMTNAVTRDPSSGCPRAALGRSWASVPNTRIFLEKGGLGKGQREWRASLMKSPRQPVGIQVEIEEDGREEP